MSNSLLTLGSFSFEGFESPEHILLKAKQRLAIHHLGSGVSIVDSLGEDCEIAAFHGIFTGSNASSRIRSVEYLRLQGMPIPLTWGSKTLSVIIQTFELNYSSNQWIPYKLTCLVVGSIGYGGGVPAEVTSVSPDTQVSGLLNLLQGTSVSPTSAQTTALAELAALNYDIASPDALQQAQELAGLINDKVATQDPTPNSSGTSSPVLLDEIAHRLTASIANAGQQAVLILAGNRLGSITVSAQNVNH